MLRYGNTGDAKYLSELINRVGDDLYFYLVKHSDTELAKDISQQAWVKVIDKRTSYSATGSFKSWLFKIGRTTLIDEYKKNNRWQSLTDEQETFVFDKNLEALFETDRLRAFNLALEQLPFLQREALVLQQEGFRLREIATITNSEIETIKTRLRYAKQLLQQLIKIEEKKHD
ncbi:MAG: sigma-70 family RNA polymerase sigma factor [Gammaproteobacteria bacterium]|nr:sigma-70 family RNA polymerase sigma factor [Gammaproteobacteria bacterium]